MDRKKRDLLIAAAVFVLTIIVGGIYMVNSSYSYTDSALLFLAAVIGAGCCWIGLCLKK